MKRNRGWRGESRRHSDARKYGKASRRTRVKPHSFKTLNDDIEFNRKLDEFVANNPKVSKSKLRKYIIARSYDYLNMLVTAGNIAEEIDVKAKKKYGICYNDVEKWGKAKGLP